MKTLSNKEEIDLNDLAEEIYGGLFLVMMDETNSDKDAILYIKDVLKRYLTKEE